jgi:ABC-type thiamine transport system substrate-binding protein
MGPASAFMMAFGDDLSIDHKNRTNRRIGARLAETFARFMQSRAHQNLVVLHGGHMQRYLGSIVQANLLL